MNSNIKLKKKDQRNLLKIKRFNIKKSTNLKNSFFYEVLNEYKWFQDAAVIGSFLSINTEIPTDSLNNFIEQSNKILCLPVMVQNKKSSLLFKKYSQGDFLRVGKYGVKEPDDIKNYFPDIIFTPCLAFDEYGYRLGYGGGYYDKTISYLKSIKHNFIVIGFAYDDQKIDNVVHDDLDQKLNYILTEKRLYKIL